MKELLEHLCVSKSTVSTELRRLSARVVVEKVLLANQHVDFYQLKKKHLVRPPGSSNTGYKKFKNDC